MEPQFLLAKAKDEELAKNGECGGAVSALFKYLLDQQLVDGVLTLTRGKMYTMVFPPWLKTQRR
ncbi:hypothetical protein GCM10025861_13340 [Methanobacterium petrolearium]|nr:hypothetical protein GCM10025861_13340 [Methanobacterium petrolearium]